jgi:GPN-loop GTPase
MEEPPVVFFTGTAGAGKTTFVRAFANWLRGEGHDATVVNLDPGVDDGPLEPDVDVREWVRLADVQDEYGLGPNGAQVAAADMIALKVFEVKQAIALQPSDYILVDTPGQVELFAFREASKAIVDALGGEQSAIAFLFDPALARAPTGFVSLLLLSATVEFRLRRPMVNLLAKTDTLPPEKLAELAAWSDEPGALYEAVTRDTPTPDIQLSTEVLRGLDAMGPLTGLLPASAQAGTGLDTFYRACQRIFAGGEDLERAQAPPDE